jgi:hypothetical protein
VLTESKTIAESVRLRVSSAYSLTSEYKPGSFSFLRKWLKALRVLTSSQMHSCNLPDAEIAKYPAFGISYALR